MFSFACEIDASLRGMSTVQYVWGPTLVWLLIHESNDTKHNDHARGMGKISNVSAKGVVDFLIYIESEKRIKINTAHSMTMQCVLLIELHDNTYVLSWLSYILSLKGWGLEYIQRYYPKTIGVYVNDELNNSLMDESVKWVMVYTLIFL